MQCQQEKAKGTCSSHVVGISQEYKSQQYEFVFAHKHNKCCILGFLHFLKKNIKSSSVFFEHSRKGDDTIRNKFCMI